MTSALPPLQKDDETLVVRTIRNKWVQVGISGIPFAGGPIQTYLSHVAYELDQRAWTGYWRSVEDRLSQLSVDKIDVDYFSSEDFVTRLRRLHAEVTSGVDDAKLKYLRDYLVACASTLAADVTWKDIFLGHLREMTGMHITVLRCVFDKQRRLSHTDRFELPQRTDLSPVCVNHLTASSGSSDEVLLEMLLADLSARGLVSLWLGRPTEPKGWSITDAGLALMHYLCELWK